MTHDDQKPLYQMTEADATTSLKGVSRDELFARQDARKAERKNDEEEVAARLAPIEARIEAHEQMYKDRDALRQELSAVSGYARHDIMAIEQAIRRAAPEPLLSAIASVKAQIDALNHRYCAIGLTPAHRESVRAQCDRASAALHKLEVLVTKPGDVVAQAKTIMGELASAAFDEVFTEAPQAAGLRTDNVNIGERVDEPNPLTRLMQGSL